MPTIEFIGGVLDGEIKAFLPDNISHEIEIPSFSCKDFITIKHKYVLECVETKCYYRYVESVKLHNFWRTIDNGHQQNNPF